MDARLRQLNRHIKNYDGDLYVARTEQGMVQVMRKSYRWDEFDFDGKTVKYLRPQPQPILPLTEDWKYSGRPVEWGIEPIMQRLKDMDAWRDDSYFDAMKKRREDKELDEQRIKRNNIRAWAADMRRDFAKSTNDINTSTLDKNVDLRRKKDGYRK